MKPLHACALLVVAGSFSGVAASQGYPARPIRLVVPFAAGQGADVAARTVAAKVSEYLKQPIVIDNKPGAGGNIGAEAAAKAAPDGYTLLVGSNGTHAANAALYASLPFDPQRDFVAVAYTGSTPMVLVSAPSHAATNVRDVMEMARAKPGAINVAIPSSTARVVLELFTQVSRAELFPVNYKASSTAVTDVIGGQIELSIDTLIATLPHVTGGKLKALGVSSRARASSLPSTPTFAEAGLAGFDLVAWNVWFAPRGTPPDIVAKLNGEIVRALAQPDVQQHLRQLGYEAGAAADPRAVAEFVAAEGRKWAELIRRAGIKAE